MPLNLHLLLEVCHALLLALFYCLHAMLSFILPLNKPKDVSGEKVLITGAGSGIGREMALRFAKLGSHLILLDVDEAGNQETARLVGELGAAVDSYKVDLCKREEIYAVTAKVKNDVGDVDILINNAGIVTGAKLLDSADRHIQRTMDVNISAHFWMVKSLLPSMLTRNHGHLVTVASGAGLFGAAGLGDYCASKFAAVGFSESMSMEIELLGKTGVKTTTICPFFINTGMFDGVKTRIPCLLPILEKDYAVDRIMDAILTNQELLCIPRILYVLIFLKSFMSIKAVLVLSNLLGITSQMDEFRGRPKKD